MKYTSTTELFITVSKIMLLCFITILCCFFVFRMCTQGTEDLEQHFIESLLLLPDSLVSKSKKKLNQNGSVDEVIEVSDEEDPEVIELE